MESQLAAYLEGLPELHRGLFERLHRLIGKACPEVTEGISYGMPTYSVGGRKLYVGSWKHGISLYGWRDWEGATFSTRYPKLRSGKATIRLRPSDADEVTDGDLVRLIRATLQG